jgi:hypothetical protein
MPLCCARKVPLRGAGGVGDSLLPSWVGHGGFGAGGARWLPSRIVARSAFSLSLPTLAPLPVLSLLRLPLSAHPPVSTTPVPRFCFPHSPRLSFPFSGGFSLALPIVHFPPLSRSIQSTALALVSTTGGSMFICAKRNLLPLFVYCLS